MSDSFEITYAAHTAACTFLLDAEGICRRIVLVPGSKHRVSSKGRDVSRSAARCVGAQYVASLDPSVSGMLAEMPRVGSAMLFACVDERGRVSLVRTGLVTRFERHRSEDPFSETDKAPSTSVQTSAPVIPPSAPTPRAPRTTPPPPEPQDPYEEDASDRTQPIHALRPAVLRSLRPASPPPRPRTELGDDDATLERTAEYESAPAERSSGASARRTWPSPRPDLGAPSLATTLRRPPPAVGPPSEDDPYAALARAVPPRRSEPYMVRPRTDARASRPPEPTITPRSPSYPSIDKLAAGRRRGDR